MQLFVTVGTTSFDTLINTIIRSHIIKVLQKVGFKKLVLQIGRSTHDPEDITVDLTTECYRYKDSLKQDINDSQLIISHAGAGTCLEVLGAEKPLLVVINEELMNNHQVELAQKLADEGHLMYCTCSTLAETLESMKLTDLKPFEAGKHQKFASFLDKIMGVS